LKAPECEGEHVHDDGYWEGVIDYGFYKNKEDFDPIRFINGQGYLHWTEYNPIEKKARSIIYDKYKNDKGYLPLSTSDEGKQMLDELKQYPGKEFAALSIRECHIKKDKLEIYHKTLSKMKEKHPEYNWLS
jgi:hypothetical protein